MDNTLLTLDFFNDSYSIRSGSVEYTWFTKTAFLEDSAFPFEDGLISLTYEPYRNIYLVDKRNQGVASGIDLPEMVWIDDNFSTMLEKGRLRRIIETPVMTVSIMRDIKLSATDWVLIRHQEESLLGIPNSLTEEQLRAVLEYRQELRDITKTIDPSTPEDQITWPISPIG